jgi:hypothetical protein
VQCESRRGEVDNAFIDAREEVISFDNQARTPALMPGGPEKAVLLLFPWVLTRDFSLRHIGKSATRPDERFGLVYGLRRGPSAKQTEGP